MYVCMYVCMYVYNYVCIQSLDCNSQLQYTISFIVDKQV